MSALENNISNVIRDGGLASNFLADAEHRHTTQRLRKLTAYLVKTHVESGGVYFESLDSELYKENLEDPRPYSANPSTIANNILPYLLWVTINQVAGFYNIDSSLLASFTKVKSSNTGIYHLEFHLTQRSLLSLSTIMMFMVVVFRDHFSSNESNKIVVNRLSYLINQRD